MLYALLIGLVIGAVAKLLMPGKDPGGFVVTMLLGVAGSFVANLIGTSMGMYREGEPAGFLASVLGAVILLAVYRMFLNKNRTITH
jgi:uncharacterized membrane protein YeaQ/YmgE (transglycosylase-associated protein family)